MHNPKILILDTKPKGFLTRAYRYLKVFIKEGLILQQWHYILRSPSQGGSFEIPRNLINTLKHRSDFTFDHNIYSSNKHYDIACVIKDLDALKWAIEQKKKGFIKKIVAGPFISTLPSDNHGVLESEHIYRLIFLCDWHRKLFLKDYQTKNVSSFVWYAGVDTHRWSPKSETEKDTVLIYKKWPNPQLEKAIEEFMQNNNLKYEMINCGFYNPEDYKMALQKSRCVVFIAHSETQGLAIFEAWSMNVPTFHWDPEFMNYYGQFFEGSSSAPYLTPDLGQKFKDFSQFQEKFIKFVKTATELNPRNVIQEKYTLDKSAQLFINEILKD